MTHSGTLLRFAALLLAARAGAQVPQSWTITVATTVDSGSAGGKLSLQMRVQVIPGKTRMSVQGSKELEGSAGMYQLFDEAQGIHTTVMPATQVALIASIPSAGGKVRASSETSPTIEVLDLGAGENLLGLATHRYRTTVTSAVRFWFYGDSCQRTVHQVGETWNTTDVAMPPDLYGRALNSALRGAIPDSTSARVMRVLAGDRIRGVPLKTVTTERRRSFAGDSTAVTTSFEITEFSLAAIDPAIFVVPPEFKVMDGREMTARMMTPALDSMVASTLRKSLCDPARH